MKLGKLSKYLRAVGESTCNVAPCSMSSGPGSSETWLGYSYCAVAGFPRLGGREGKLDFIQGQGKVRGFCIMSAELLNPCSKSMKSHGNF